MSIEMHARVLDVLRPMALLPPTNTKDDAAHAAGQQESDGRNDRHRQHGGELALARLGQVVAAVLLDARDQQHRQLVDLFGLRLFALLSGRLHPAIAQLPCSAASNAFTQLRSHVHLAQYRLGLLGTLRVAFGEVFVDQTYARHLHEKKEDNVRQSKLLK